MAAAAPHPNAPRPGAPPPAAGARGGPHSPARPTHSAAPRRPAQVQDPLAILTPQQIKAQATQTVKAAYQPVYTGLNQQSAQEQAILAKQEADNQYYMQWLNSKSTALQVQQNVVDQSTQQLETQLTGNASAALGAQPGALTAAATANAGNVSAEGSAFHAGTPLGNALTANEGAQQGIENAAATRSLDQERIAEGQLGASSMNAANALQAGRTAENANFNTAMKAIANAKTTDLAKETGDIEKEIARLQGVNINVASSNRSYAAAAEKLGITLANTKSEIGARAAAAQVAQQNANTRAGQLKLNLTKAQLTQMNSDRNFKLAQQRYGLAAAKDIYEREHGLGPYRPSASGGQKPLSTISQNTIYRRIDTITGQINQLIATYGLTPQQAYHVMQHGGYVQGAGTSTGKPTKIHIQPVRDGAQILNAAYNLRSGGPGLDSGDMAALKAMGLAHPLNHYGQATPVPSRSQISQGAANSPH